METTAAALLAAARSASQRGDGSTAFAAIREALVECDWTAALVKAAGDTLGQIREDSSGGFPAAVERVAIIGTCTTGLLVPAVCCALAREGRLARVYEGPFGALRQEILDSGSGLYSFRPDTVLVVRTWRDLAERAPLPGATADEVEDALAQLVREDESLWSALASRAACRILQHEIERPDLEFIGEAECLNPSALTGFFDLLQSRLWKAGSGRVVWIRTRSAAFRVGSERWLPADFYHLAKLPLSAAQIATYARLFAAAWRVAAHCEKKVLVTDLDNTLWGGIVGDDGLSGIALGPGTAAGEGFRDFSRYLLGLGRRGVILAVCSKNEPAVAIQPFREHPAMPLREEDFAVFHCSWNDKVTGLREIVARLNVGLDSVVFVDDNPAECALVRRELPEVVTVLLRGSPSQFPRQLDELHLFDRSSFTREDLERGRLYRSRARAEESLATATDLDGFLRELEMEGRLTEPSEGDLERVAQLEAKTNQFNTRTTRYAKATLEQMASDPDHLLLALRLRDRFADHGLISAVVLRIGPTEIGILNWTMSCRVFSRGAETFVRNQLLIRCRALGRSGIRASYEPTPKNGVIHDLFQRLGFERTAGGEWFLAAEAEPLICHIRDGAAEGAGI